MKITVKILFGKKTRLPIDGALNEVHQYSNKLDSRATRHVPFSFGSNAKLTRMAGAGINNAHFASVATYSHLVPAFRALLAIHADAMSEFYIAVNGFTKLDNDARHAALAAVLR